MTWAIGAVDKAVQNTSPSTTVTKAITLTAGSSVLVFGAALQTGGGTRTLICSSDLDGALTIDLSSGALATPAYLFRKDNVIGGSTTFTLTASGNCANLIIFITEVQFSAMVFKGTGINTSFSATTNWDSGAFTTGATTQMFYTGLYITNRTDGVISSCDDANSHSYTVGQKQITTSGESINDAYYFGQLASEAAEAQATVSVSATGRMLVAAYGAAASNAAPKIYHNQLRQRR